MELRCEEAQELHGRRVRPVQIVDHEQLRPVLRGASQNRPNGVEQPESGNVGIGVVGVATAHRPVASQSGEDRVAVDIFGKGDLREELRPRPERWRGRVVPTAHPTRRGVGGGRRTHGFLREPRLADTRFAREHHQIPATAAQRVDDELELTDLALPPDKVGTTEHVTSHHQIGGSDVTCSGRRPLAR